MKQKKGFFLAFIIALAGLYSCDTIDCTLDNTVDMVSNIYQDGKNVAISDALSITNADGSVVLLNRKTNASTLKLSLSYFQPVDTLVLTLAGEDYHFTEQTGAPDLYYRYSRCFYLFRVILKDENCCVSE